jgi:ribosomal protein S11
LSTSTKRTEKWGVVHIFSSYNNTIIHITDISGAETHRTHKRRHVRQSRPHGILTLRRHARSHRSRRNSTRQRLTAVHIKVRAPGGSGPRTQDQVHKQPSEPLHVRLPHRTHRRSYSCTTRRHPKTRGQKRQTRLVVLLSFPLP